MSETYVAIITGDTASFHTQCDPCQCPPGLCVRFQTMIRPSGSPLASGALAAGTPLGWELSLTTGSGTLSIPGPASPDWIPPAPHVDPSSITETGANVIAPGGLPSGLSLTLQLRPDVDESSTPCAWFTNYATGVGSGATVSISGLQKCRWYIVRWLAVPSA